MKRYIVVDSTDKEYGIFHILNELENCDMEPSDWSDYEWAMRKFNYELHIPSYKNGIETEAWFTGNGAEYFEEAIDVLHTLINEYLGNTYYFYELNKCSLNRIMYKDNYQVIYIK